MSDTPVIENRKICINQHLFLEKVGITLIALFALILRLTDISRLGYVNHYYTAAVVSMLHSWKNFFFVAAEPGGAVSVDKPPVGLWLQTISARIFGVNGFAVLLPQIVTGVLSVILLYFLVRRYYGVVAGLLSALVFSITPVVVATDRNNTMDSILVFTLLLAVWAVSNALEKGKVRYLYLAAVCIGVGFNIKMLAAFLPLPALWLVYLLGSSDGWRRRILNLFVASALLIVVSISWAFVVDRTPAEQRPFIGSSGDNSVASLITGYNGIQRLMGMGGFRNLAWNFGGRSSNVPQRLPGVNSADADVPVTSNMPQDWAMRGLDKNSQRPPQNSNPRLMNPGNRQPMMGRDGFSQRNPRNAGGIDSGAPGLFRLVMPPMSNQIGWLLPLGLINLVLLALSTPLRLPLSVNHFAAVLWGGWFITGGVFFSIAGFIHPYYVTLIAAPLAAIIGIGVSELWQMAVKRPWFSISFLLFGVVLTLGFQIFTAQLYINSAWWLLLPIFLFTLGSGLLIGVANWDVQWNMLAGFCLVIFSVLVIPAIWSGLTVRYPDSNQSLPSAYTGQTGEPTSLEGLNINTELIEYIEQRTKEDTYLMAVPSSMQGSDYVIATGRPVLYIGGFMGQDKVVTKGQLANLVANGELRFLYWNTAGSGFDQQSEISTWVVENCEVVQGFETSASNFGTPDGTASLAGRGVPGGRQDFHISLYDCSVNVSSR